MAGTLTLTTLSDGTNSTSATNCIQGSAKAWVNFTGSSGAIKASFNVSSITRASTGFYTVTFTTAISDANFSAVVSASNLADVNGTFTTTTLPMRTFNDAGSSTDPANVCVAVFR